MEQTVNLGKCRKRTLLTSTMLLSGCNAGSRSTSTIIRLMRVENLRCGVLSRLRWFEGYTKHLVLSTGKRLIFFTHLEESAFHPEGPCRNSLSCLKICNWLVCACLPRLSRYRMAEEYPQCTCCLVFIHWLNKIRSYSSQRDRTTLRHENKGTQAGDRDHDT